MDRPQNLADQARWVYDRDGTLTVQGQEQVKRMDRECVAASENVMGYGLMACWGVALLSIPVILFHHSHWLHWLILCGIALAVTFFGTALLGKRVLDRSLRNVQDYLAVLHQIAILDEEKFQQVRRKSQWDVRQRHVRKMARIGVKSFLLVH